MMIVYNDYIPPAPGPMYNPYNMYSGYTFPLYPYWPQTPMYNWKAPKPPIPLQDYGPHPYAVDIERATVQNDTFRTALWTGTYLQLTLMSINAGDQIGLEMHPDVDQFIRIEEGQGLVKMGSAKDALQYQAHVYDGYAALIPAGIWHNVINTGCTPLKLYSIYAPPNHPWGTVHRTKQEAEESETHSHVYE